MTTTIGYGKITKISGLTESLGNFMLTVRNNIVYFMQVLDAVVR